MSDDKGKEEATTEKKVEDVQVEKKNQKYLNELPYEFVKEEHEPELTCSICTLLCLDPVVIATCGHYFCREHLLKTDGVCPMCRGQWTQETLLELDPIKDRAVRNIFARELVRCNGCKKTMERGLKGELYHKHFREECPVHCPKGCKDVELTLATLDQHLQVCPFEIVKCAAVDLGCETETERRNIEDHQKSCTRFHLAPLFREQRERIAQLETTVARLSRRQPCISLKPPGTVESDTLVLSTNPQNVEGFIFDDNNTLRIVEGGKYHINILLLAKSGTEVCPLIQLNGDKNYRFYSSGNSFGNASLNVDIDIQPNSIFRVCFQTGYNGVHVGKYHHVQITRLGDL